MMDELFILLKKLHITYQKFDHKPVSTVEEAQFIKDHLNGIGCKNLFLKDKDNHYYFILLNDQKKGDLKYYQNYLKTSRLSFASM